MRRMIVALACVTFVIASSLCLQAQDAATSTSAPATADAAKIKALVKDLSSDDYKTREQAQKDLVAIGSSAKDELGNALKSEDMEVKQRAEQILAAIAKTELNVRNNDAKKKYLWGFAIDNGMYAKPVVAGDVILASGLDGMVHAVDIKTGKEVWATTDVPVATRKPGDDPTSKPSTSPASKPADKSEAKEKKANQVLVAGPGGVAAKVIMAGMRVDSTSVVLSAPVVSDGMFVYSDGKQINCASLKGGKLAWSLLADGQPMVSDGLVFVGSNNGGLDAIDIKTGKLAWHAKNAISTFTRPAVGDGFVCLAGTVKNKDDAPAVRPMGMGRVEILISSLVGTHVQALDIKTGKELWKVPAENCQAVHVAGELVIWQASDALKALDAKNGKQVWGYTLPPAGKADSVVHNGSLLVRMSTGLVDADDLLISGKSILFMAGGEQIAIDATTGKELWRVKLDFFDKDATPESDDNTPGRQPRIQTVVQGGARMQILVASNFNTPVMGGAIRPVVDDKTVYATSSNAIYALDIKTGQQLWVFRTSGMPNGKLVLVDGVLYYGSTPQQPPQGGGADVIGLNAIKTK